MKKTLLICCAAALAFASCNSGGENNKPKSDSTPNAELKPVAPPVAAMPDSATQMKNWQEYMAVGEMQKMMASWDGVWDGELTSWVPGMPEQKSKMTTVNKMVMGGRYQVSNHSGNMNGMKFEGMGTMAYDNAKKIFISSWIDNLGTGMMRMEGHYDTATKTITLIGKGVDPTSYQERDYRETFSIIDNNTQLLTMYGPGPDGKETKNMEIKFTRKK